MEEIKREPRFHIGEQSFPVKVSCTVDDDGKKHYVLEVETGQITSREN